jgi:hypothetical protein
VYATVIVALLLTEAANVRTTVAEVPDAVTVETVAGFPSTRTAKLLDKAVVALMVSL